MSRNILTSAKTYLATTSNFRIAHLVRLETASNPSTYIYLTDYQAGVTHNNVVYQAGKIKSIGEVRQTQGLANYKLSINIAGEYVEELARALTENTNTSYVGRDIEVLRAYIDTDGTIVDFDDPLGTDVGTGNKPLQYFIGDITDINITEGVTTGNSTVVWQCAGKFADFNKVTGRITDDTSHRGLQLDLTTGKYEPTAGAKLVSHQTDRGFQHAAKTVDISAKYTATEKAYRMKKRHWWQSDKLVEYDVEVERTLEMGVDLASKFIPKVYGVRKVAGIPVFIDVVKGNENVVYVVYAFAEGEVDAFLNLYIEDQSLICNTDATSDVCLGSKQNGDTLSAFMSQGAISEIQELHNSRFSTPEDGGRTQTPIISIPPVSGVSRSQGTSHTKVASGGNNLSNELVHHFTVTNESGTKELWVHHGKSDQNANQELVNIAANNGFFRQDEWVAEDPDNRVASQYWDNDCRLLDTAYIVMKLSISADETVALPDVEAVIQSGTVDTYDTAGSLIGKEYTLNPVWHLLDYITSPVYGAGGHNDQSSDVALSIESIDLKSFAAVAARQDIISDTYDNEFLSYWRYSGWVNEPIDQSTLGHDPQKTVMQCNAAIKTENTVTKNTKAMLAQFDATLNILGGKYHLSVETDDAPIANIKIEEAKGSVKTKDLSTKSKWNSIQASIVDPSKGWATTAINFFNSEYLEQDNGVKKKGNVGFNFITNYYTAREWAERQLRKSRFSREVTLTLGPKYLYLYPNANVTFEYARFWVGLKTFRVGSITLRSDGTVDVTLLDFGSSVYTQGSASTLQEVSTPVVVVSPPVELEFVKLPSTRFDISTLSTENVNGILVWKTPVTSASISRFSIRDWNEVTTDTSVPFNQTIVDTQDGLTRHYTLIANLVPETAYTFKARTISTTGAASKYAIFGYSTSVTLSPIKFEPVIGFNASNADDISGQFSGPNLDMSWTAHTAPAVFRYEVQILSSDGLTVLRNVSTTATVYSYTLALNKSDYASTLGGIGAYRLLRAKIRATNGLASNDPDFAYSEWVNLI